MVFKSSYGSNLPKGIPGLIYLDAKDYGRFGMSLDERRNINEKIYGWLRAILPDKEFKNEEQHLRVQKLLDEMPDFLNNLRRLIPHNEMKDDAVIIPMDLENIHKNLAAIFGRCQEIIHISGIIDNVPFKSPQVPDADE